MSTKHTQLNTHSTSTSKRKLSRPADKQFDLIEGRLDRLREWRQKRNAKSGEGDGDGDGDCTRRFFRSLRLHVVLCRVCKPQLIVPHGKDTLSGVANLIGDAKSGIEQVSQCVRVCVCLAWRGCSPHCFGLLCRRHRRLQTALHTHRRSAKFSLRLQLNFDLTAFKRAAHTQFVFLFCLLDCFDCANCAGEI